MNGIVSAGCASSLQPLVEHDTQWRAELADRHLIPIRDKPQRWWYHDTGDSQGTYYQDVTESNIYDVAMLYSSSFLTFRCAQYEVICKATA